MALLFAGAQSKQLAKGRFIPFISICLSFSAGDQSSPLSKGLAEPLAVPHVKAGIACLLLAAELQLGTAYTTSPGTAKPVSEVKIPGVAAVGKSLFAPKHY